MIKEIVLIGAGGHAASIADAINSSGGSVIGFVDEAKKGEKVLNLDVYSNIKDLKDFQSYEYVISLGDNSLRQKVLNKSLSEYPDIKFATVIHRTAYVSEYATIEKGSVILGKSFVGPRSHIGNHCIINTGSKIDHDCFLDDFSSTGPGAVIGGNVKIGTGSIVSIGATIKHGITIGCNSLIGAMSFLNKDIKSNLIYYGIPAKEIRSRESDEAYL